MKNLFGCGAKNAIYAAQPLSGGKDPPGKDGGQDLSVEQGVSAWMLQLDPAAWAEIYALLPEETRDLWQGGDLLSSVRSYALSGNYPTAEEVFTALADGVAAQFRGELPLLLTETSALILNVFSNKI